VYNSLYVLEKFWAFHHYAGVPQDAVVSDFATCIVHRQNIQTPNTFLHVDVGSSATSSTCHGMCSCKRHSAACMPGPWVGNFQQNCTAWFQVQVLICACVVHNRSPETETAVSYWDFYMRSLAKRSLSFRWSWIRCKSVSRVALVLTQTVKTRLPPFLLPTRLTLTPSCRSCWRVPSGTWSASGRSRRGAGQQHRR
jgi:hypothetical protein